MPSLLAKPSAGRARFQTCHPLATGAKLWLPLNEGSGPPRDVVSRRTGNLVGSPTWRNGLYGPQLGGFSASNYVNLDAWGQIVGTIFPWCLAVMAVNTSTSQAMVMTQGDLANSRFIYMGYNLASVGTVRFRALGSSGSIAMDSGAVPCNDGLPHVLSMVGWSPGDTRGYFDGAEVAASAATIGSQNLPRLTIGCYRAGGTVNTPFNGSVVHAGAWNRQVPNQAALSRDWISGRFAAIRPPEFPADVFI